MKKILGKTLIALVACLVLAFWALYFSPRPPLTTAPATLAGDGSLVDYCELPDLDGDPMPSSTWANKKKVLVVFASW